MARSNAHEDIKRLAALRLERDLTYLELSDAIGIGYATLHALLTASTPPRIHDRTRHKIRQYLANTKG